MLCLITNYYELSEKLFLYIFINAAQGTNPWKVE